MSAQDQRLAEYLKRAVPEPPVRLSPEEITMQKEERSRKSWAIPILAAAAVVAIGVVIGGVATHHPATRPPAVSPAADQGSGGPAGSAATSGTASSASSASSAQAAASSDRPAAVAVPSVIGMTQVQATQVLEAAGFIVTVHRAAPAALAAQPGRAGEVWGQAPPAGSRVNRATVITLDVTPK